MGRVYTVSVSAVTVSAAQDFFEILAGASQTIRILSAFIGQSSDAGDAEAEMLGVLLKRGSGSFNSGTGGSTPTAVPHHFSDTAVSSTTIEANNTGQASAGSGALTTIRAESMNVQAGWYYTPTPEEVIVLSPSQALVVSITAPGDPLTMYGSITFEIEGAA